MSHKIFETALADIYPHYVAKVERKGKGTVADMRAAITWLTGMSETELDAALADRITLREFFAKATLNPASTLITGSICGVKIQEIDDPLMQQIRYMDKLVDEVAAGKKLEKVLRAMPAEASIDTASTVG